MKISYFFNFHQKKIVLKLLSPNDKHHLRSKRKNQGKNY